MNKNTLLQIALGVLVIICAVCWYREGQALRQLRHVQVADTLEPIAEMLKENEGLTRELQSAEYVEPGNGIVGAYLIKIRRDGVPKHSDMKQRIDRIVNNNTAILALLAKYSTHARTAAFRASAEQFRDYAVSLRDRWQSVFEIFMAGGNLPVAAPPFPADFDRAVASELAAGR